MTDDGFGLHTDDLVCVSVNNLDFESVVTLGDDADDDSLSLPRALYKYRIAYSVFNTFGNEAQRF